MKYRIILAMLLTTVVVCTVSVAQVLDVEQPYVNPNPNVIQPPAYDRCILINTSDGPLVVRQGMLSLRDYVLVVETVSGDIIKLVDIQGYCTATLDISGDDGIVLIIDDGKEHMKMFASWKNVMKGPEAYSNKIISGSINKTYLLNLLVSERTTQKLILG